MSLIVDGKKVNVEDVRKDQNKQQSVYISVNGVELDADKLPVLKDGNIGHLEVHDEAVLTVANTMTTVKMEGSPEAIAEYEAFMKRLNA